MSFKQIDPKPDFVQMEKKLLDKWCKSGLVNKYLHRNDKSNKLFSFLDGPITANNPMGVHHAWGRTYKDLWQRYHNMKGCHQRFQNGFDNQGLWVEVEVEKKMGFKDKKEIERYGIDKFVNQCKEHTLHFAKVQTEQSKRLGYFMDWDHSYYTMNDENNYMIWKFLKKCWQTQYQGKPALYKGRDSVPWCPRCGTAISQHEILTEEYKELTHDSVFLKYPLKDKKNYFFLVWTTTPWTIPSNVALAVNPEFTYAEFKNKETGEVVIFCSDLAKGVLGNDSDWQKTKEFAGTKLAGLYYEGPFDQLPAVTNAKKEKPKTFHLVFTNKDNVNAQEGTGIVHIAPGAGEEDFQMGIRENLPILASIDETANYLNGYGEFSGKNAKKQPELIFEYLKKKDKGRFLFKILPYTHRYPVCWRCKTELVWRVVDEWYIAMDAYRENIKKVTKQIHWIPEWGLKMELDWLTNMHDWLISKKRYWGLALPIWECSCGYFEVIGSKEELKSRAISGWSKFEGHTPHRPWIDEVKLKCPKCQKFMNRIPDVGNPWLDAGIVSFSTLVDPKTKKVSYLTDKKYWQKWFPADFVTECYPGQFKNWFYSLLAMATVLEEKPPFKTLLGHGLVKDEKGEEMHKSKGNAIDFNQAADKIGVDVMRWVFCSQNPEFNLNFGYHIADETRRRFHLLLWNIYNFFITYANIDKFRVEEQERGRVEKNVLDRWIMSKLNGLVKEVSCSLDNYDAYNATQRIEKFVEDFSTWYVRRSRERVGPTVKESEDKNSCYFVLWEVLASLSQLLAPFIPFMAEEIYMNLMRSQSVHLSDWPTVGKINEKLEKNMELVRKVCELGHSARKAAGLKVRQPLKKITIYNLQLMNKEEFFQLIKDELNVKEIIFKSGKGELKVEFDEKITPELIAEGEARELARQIQGLRREKGCRLDEKVKVFSPLIPKNSKLVNYIIQKTLASELIFGKELKIVRG